MSYDKLANSADQALYISKRMGRGRYSFYHDYKLHSTGER